MTDGEESSPHPDLRREGAANTRYLEPGEPIPVIAPPGRLVDFDGAWQLRGTAGSGAHGNLQPTPAALAEMIVARLREHRTFDSQCAAMNEAGIAASRALLAGWQNGAAEALAPVAAAVAHHGRQASLISAANVSFGQRYAPDRRLWLYLAGEGGGQRPLLWLRITPDRLGGYAAQELEGFSGLLQAPPMAGYDRIAHANGRPLVGCWDQLREQVAEMERLAPHPLLREIAETSFRLRSIDGTLNGASAETREAVRGRDARPLVEALQETLHRWRQATDPLSPIGEFISDLSQLWPALTLFLADERVPLVNMAGRRLHDLLVPGNRWLFGRHQDSRNSTAVLYTLTETCVLNDVDPRAYLAWLLTRIGEAESRKYPENLLPWHYAVPFRDERQAGSAK